MPDIANVAEEIEITPEMVEAGVACYETFRTEKLLPTERTRAEILVERIYKAMQAF